MATHLGIAREKLVRIYNPVDVARLRQFAAARTNPYQGNGPHLVVAGRLQKEKGLDLLLDAMPAVVQRFPGVRLSILGEGPDEIKLKAQATRLGIAQQIDFLGFQENPWPYFSNADLFILPSRLEGMPNALLECLALGTPALATDCPGGIREMQQAVGSIDLVPVEDAPALAAAIISALCKPAEYRRKPVAAALDNFDPQQIAAEYSKVL
jgi:glycosyltransferase involved in cell wall biosynthesis